MADHLTELLLLKIRKAITTNIAVSFFREQYYIESERRFNHRLLFLFLHSPNLPFSNPMQEYLHLSRNVIVIHMQFCKIMGRGGE